MHFRWQKKKKDETGFIRKKEERLFLTEEQHTLKRYKTTEGSECSTSGGKSKAFQQAKKQYVCGQGS